MKKASKKVIAVDIDEVLAGFIDYFVEYHNLHFKTTITKDKVVTFDLEDVFGVTKEEISTRMIDFGKAGHNVKMKPVAGSIEGVDALLEKGYELHLVTSRPGVIEKDTRVWIENHFSGKFTDLHHAFNQKIHKEGSKKKKWEICKEIGAGVLVDDFLPNALSCAENGITVYLMDAPWNQTEDLPENVIRVKSWKEITAQL